MLDGLDVHMRTLLLATLSGCVVPASTGVTTSSSATSLGATPAVTAPAQLARVPCSGHGELDLYADGTIDLVYEVEVDAHGNDLLRETFDGATGELESSVVWTRTPDGRPLTYQHVENSWQEWTYDSSDHEVSRRAFADNELYLEYETTWTNDLRVQQLMHTPGQDPTVTTWEYGPDGRELEMRREQPYREPMVVSWVWYGSSSDHDQEWDSGDDGTVEAVESFRVDALDREISYSYEGSGLYERREIQRDAYGREISRTESDTYETTTTETTWGGDGRIAETWSWTRGDLAMGEKHVTTWTWTCPED